MRYYSSVATTTTLTAPITGSATSMAVDSTTGFPGAYPYTLSLEPDTGSKELVEVTGASGLTLMVTRGIDGTSGTAHALGAIVRHDHSARDFRESREHEIATAGVHGATGAVVGTTNTQVVTNKDLSSGNTFPTSFATKAGVETFTNKNLTDPTNTFPSSFATKAGVETFTNKDLTSGTNTFPTTLVTLAGTQAVTNKDLTSGTNVFPTSLVTLTGAQTLTNKTLTAPTLNTPTIATPAITGGTVAGATYSESSGAQRIPWTAANKAALASAPFSTAANGDVAATTDGNLYERTGGVWSRVLVGDSGSSSVGGGGASFGWVDITYNETFATTPRVFCEMTTAISSAGGSFTTWTSNKTTTGFRFNFDRQTAIGAPLNFDWTALA